MKRSAMKLREGHQFDSDIFRSRPNENVQAFLIRITSNKKAAHHRTAFLLFTRNHKSGQVKPVKVHHFGPGFNKVVYKLLSCIPTSIYLGNSTKLGVGTEDKIGTGAGPFDLAARPVGTREHFPGIRGGRPGG